MIAISAVPLPAAYLLAVGATLALTPVVRARARAADLVARPSGDRWHRSPTALLGGIAIYGGFLTGAVGLLLWFGGGAVAIGRIEAGILLAATMMFVTGVADDILRLRPTTKLVLQGLAAAVLVTFGVHYELTPWTAVNVAVTLIWFIVLTNALNLLDNMDGAAAGVAGVGALFLTGMFLLEGAWSLAVISAALAGATAGFLPFNLRRASIFMGDCGSLFLGAVLAGLGAAFSGMASGGWEVAAVAPVLVVIVPVFDTMFVSVTRTAARYALTQGGRDHVAHRLVTLGFSETGAVMLLYLLAAIGGTFALLLWGGVGGAGPWLATLFLVGLMVFGAYLSRFYHYPPEGARLQGRTMVLLGDLLYRRRVLEALLDLVVFGVAYSGAYLLRYDASLPPNQVALLTSTLALAVACKSVAFGLTGVYRGMWQRFSMVDLHQLLKATALGTLLTLACMVFLFREAEFSRSVLVLDALLVVLLASGVRASFRSLDLMRYSLNGAGARTLIYGAGVGGELILREMLSNSERGLHPVGLVDDDPTKHGRAIHGLPVLGGGEDIEEIAVRQGIEKVVIGTRQMRPDRLEFVSGVCRTLEIELLQLEVELRSVPLLDWAAVAQREQALEPAHQVKGRRVEVGRT